MKKLVISMILLTTGFACFGQVYLTSGESCVFDFTLPYTRAAQGDIPTVTIFFSGGEVGSNWSEMTQFFPNSVSDSPFATDTYTHTGPVPPGEQVGRGISFDPNSPPPWPDLQGAVQVTALSGSFQVDQMFVQEDVNGGYYSLWVYPVPVPEPSLSLLLLLAGALCLAVARSQIRNRLTHAPNPAFAPRFGSGSPSGRGR